MLFVKFLLITGGFGLLCTAVGILVWDLYLILRPRPLSVASDEVELEGGRNIPFSSLRWKSAAQLATVALVPLLLGVGIAVVPGGQAGVRVSQFGGALPGTLYPGVHWVTPLVEHVELFNIRDRVFSTRLSDEQIGQLQKGVILTDGPTQPAIVKRIRDSAKYSFIEVIIREGRNRQVRRMIEAIGSKVLKLVRTEIGGVRIGDLPIGKHRELTPEEIKMLTPHRSR